MQGIYYWVFYWKKKVSFLIYKLWNLVSGDCNVLLYYLYQFYIYIQILNIFILSFVSQNMSFSFSSL